jgi:hypothetical protein
MTKKTNMKSNDTIRKNKKLFGHVLMFGIF